MASILFSRDGVTLSCTGELMVLRMGRDQNRINPTMTSLLVEALDIVEEREGSGKALVLTGGEGSKFFSNGLDIEWMMGNGTEVAGMVKSFCLFLSRLLVLDCPTVAAINGHAFGAGFFLALCCDHRLMRTSRGFMNLPELGLGMSLSKPFAELAKSKLGPRVLRQAVLGSARFGSEEAVDSGVADGECAIEDLLPTAIKRAESWTPAALGSAKGFNPKRYQGMKIELYTDAYRALREGSVNALPESKL